MSAAEATQTDLIEELRLRHWARRYYVPRELRLATWHPIVLAEMAYRDEELSESHSGYRYVRTPFVPLAPDDRAYLDEAHPPVPAPLGLLSPRDNVTTRALLADEFIAGF
jgi:hypothetical protein